jgi:hypothetical protein
VNNQQNDICETTELPRTQCVCPDCGRMESPSALIALLQAIRPEFGAVGSRDVDVRAQRDRIDAAIPMLAHIASPYQARVQPWLMQCFGAMIAGDREERNHRFFEEASELVQSLGMSASEAHQLVDYVWNRPVGEPNQEVGGTMVTLAALCLANGLDMHTAAEKELARVWTKVEQIRAKQAAKPKHSPLPEHVTAAPASDERRTAIYRKALAMGDGPDVIGAAAERAAWIHELKIDHDPFFAMLNGDKTHEIRRDDRGFKVGDTLFLRETRYTAQERIEDGRPVEYTGRTLTRTVTHIQRGYGLPDGIVVMSLAAPVAAPLANPSDKQEPSEYWQRDPAYWATSDKQEAVTVVPDGDGPDHDDDIAVDVFARVMKTKMAEQRAKGYDGWKTASRAVLSDLLHQCVTKGDPRDVAIVSMMLWSHGATIQPWEPDMFWNKEDTEQFSHSADDAVDTWNASEGPLPVGAERVFETAHRDADMTIRITGHDEDGKPEWEYVTVPAAAEVNQS